MLLQQRYPRSQRVGVESYPNRLARTRQQLALPAWQFWKSAPAVQQQAPAGQAQMLWSNMALHVHPDPQALLRQWHEALAVDGFVMFSCLGPDSMRELRDVYAHLGWPPPTHDFTDMHDWGDLLVQAGFAEPVMDMERITLTYGNAEALLADLRALGRNLNASRHPGLRGRGWRRRLVAALEEAGALSRPGGGSEREPVTGEAAGRRLHLTFEIIYGHALKPTPRAKVAAQTQVPLQDLKAMLGQRPNRG
jgi:malonyl-CoA O-methyltransferase